MPKSLWIGLVGLVVLGAGLTWWILGATPAASLVGQYRTAQQPIPDPDLSVLDDPAFADAPLPAVLPSESTGPAGRSDPYSKP